MSDYDCHVCGNDPEDCYCGDADYGEYVATQCQCTEEAVDPNCPIHYTPRSDGEV